MAKNEQQFNFEWEKFKKRFPDEKEQAEIKATINNLFEAAAKQTSKIKSKITSEIYLATKELNSQIAELNKAITEKSKTKQEIIEKLRAPYNAEMQKLQEETFEMASKKLIEFRKPNQLK